MARFYIIGGILAVAMAVYAIVDLTITDDRRIRRLNRVLWAVLIVLVPVVGPLGWLFWGKAPRSFAPPQGPEDSKEFRTQTGTWVSADESDRRIAELEQQLAALDDEELADRSRRVQPEVPDDQAEEPGEEGVGPADRTSPSTDERDDDSRRG
ncbi:PLD nuclease N-terminal domain-containing protein [Agrococcus sp. SGAir0287]|uniref:PLD nuclease N-terminal domain-containing protein n=1 Tax=Agrococcus sp. SGAir0287 TaxID=2070347 RepID=UPI0020C76AA9|nr:PLDc N-terminal domain-containing protein [Agrococcus sp. SGAir0287]